MVSARWPWHVVHSVSLEPVRFAAFSALLFLPDSPFGMISLQWLMIRLPYCCWINHLAIHSCTALCILHAESKIWALTTLMKYSGKPAALPITHNAPEWTWLHEGTLLSVQNVLHKPNNALSTVCYLNYWNHGQTWTIHWGKSIEANTGVIMRVLYGAFLQYGGSLQPQSIESSHASWDSKRTRNQIRRPVEQAN